MNDLNKVILVGTLVRNPDIKDINGLMVCNFGLEVNHESQSGSTEKLIVNITAFGGQATNCMQYLKYGSRAIVEGRLTYNPKNDEMFGVTANIALSLDQKDR